MYAKSSLEALVTPVKTKSIDSSYTESFNRKVTLTIPEEELFVSPKATLMGLLSNAFSIRIQAGNLAIFTGMSIPDVTVFMVDEEGDTTSPDIEVQLEDSLTVYQDALGHIMASNMEALLGELSELSHEEDTIARVKSIYQLALQLAETGQTVKLFYHFDEGDLLPLAEIGSAIKGA